MGKPDIRERTFQYALCTVKLYEAVRRTCNSGGEILCRQFLRSATSIGANLEKGQHAENKPGFVHKMSIARKEARECLYWLRLIKEWEVHPEKRLTLLMQETDEVHIVPTSIILAAKRGSRR